MQFGDNKIKTGKTGFEPLKTNTGPKPETNIIPRLGEEQSQVPGAAFVPGTPIKLNLKFDPRQINPEKPVVNYRQHTAPDEKTAIIDGFKLKDDLDEDKKTDFPHGEMVTIIASNGEVQTIPLERNFIETADRLREVRQRAEQGEDISQVNISLGIKMNIEDLNRVLGYDKKPDVEQLTPANIKSKHAEIYELMKQKYEFANSPERQAEIKQLEEQKREIVTQLYSDKTEEENQQLKSRYNELRQVIDDHYHMLGFERPIQIYDEIEKLASPELNIPVVIAAGNKDEHEMANNTDIVNLYSINPNAVVVGAFDEGGNIAEFSAESSLVDVYTKGVYTPADIGEANAKKLTSIQQKMSENPGLSSSEVINTSGSKIRGSSFAAPYASKNYVREMQLAGMNVVQINQSLEKARDMAQTESISIDKAVEKVINAYKKQ
ncbi:MAG: S8/S53 family peptidase [Cyanobacteriota bacterium]